MDFSASLHHYISVNYLYRDALITTELWRPIAKAFNITQIPSKNGHNFKVLHTIIHQVKTWIRTT